MWVVEFEGIFGVGDKSLIICIGRVYNYLMFRGLLYLLKVEKEF